MKHLLGRNDINITPIRPWKKNNGHANYCLTQLWLGLHFFRTYYYNLCEGDAYSYWAKEKILRKRPEGISEPAQAQNLSRKTRKYKYKNVNYECQKRF